MDRHIKILLGFLVILFLLATIITGALSKLNLEEHNNWWTKVFCLKEQGNLQEKFWRDTCIIDGEEYFASFVKTEEKSNLTYSHTSREWQLIKRK